MATARWQEFPKFACYIVTCLLPPLRGWVPPNNPSNCNNNHFLGWLVGFLRWYLFWSQFLASLYQKSASHRWDKKTYPNNLSNLKFASAAVTWLAWPILGTKFSKKTRSSLISVEFRAGKRVVFLFSADTRHVFSDRISHHWIPSYHLQHFPLGPYRLCSSSPPQCHATQVFNADPSGERQWRRFRHRGGCWSNVWNLGCQEDEILDFTKRHCQYW